MLKKIFILAVLPLIVACSSSPTPVEESLQTQVLHYGNGSEPQTLDPHLATGIPESHILPQLYEGLMNYDPKTALPIPGVAESHTISPNGLVYTFKIRSDAKWSNGTPVTANDFVYGWKRILSPKLASEYSFMLFALKNAKNYTQSKITDFSEVGVKALDDHTLQVTLENPTPYFLSLLCHQSTYPALKSNVEQYGAMDSRNNKWSRAEFAVTNGPFQFKSWKVNKEIVIVPNPHYWDKDKVKLKEVHFYPIDQRQTDERRYRAGETHITDEMDLPKLKTYIKEKPEHVYRHPWIGSYFYLINTKVKPMDNQKVRMALKMSLDRKAIVNTVTQGAHMESGQFIPPGLGGYHSDFSIPYDVKAAQKLLAEAGYPGGKGFPTITLKYNTDEEHRSLAESVQQMWRQNLGISVQIQNEDWKVYLNDLYSGNFDLVRRGWIGDYNDPYTFVSIFVSDQAMDNSGWVNKDYDRLVNQSEKTSDSKKRMELFRQAEKIFLEDGPIIPLYTYSRVYLVSPYIQGWYPNSMDIHPLKEVYLKKVDSK